LGCRCSMAPARRWLVIGTTIPSSSVDSRKRATVDHSTSGRQLQRCPCMGRMTMWVSALGAGGALGWWATRRLRRRNGLDGQVAIVTGGSRGLGLRIARELAEAGCALAICARTAAELNAAGLELAGAGTGVLARVVDVS